MLELKNNQPPSPLLSPNVKARNTLMVEESETPKAALADRKFSLMGKSKPVLDLRAYLNEPIDTQKTFLNEAMSG